MKNIMRMKHYSLQTEKSYIQWVRRYIYFHNKRHPDEMGALDIQKLRVKDIDIIANQPYRKFQFYFIK